MSEQDEVKARALMAEPDPLNQTICVNCGKAIDYAEYGPPINSSHWYHLVNNLLWCTGLSDPIPDEVKAREIVEQFNALLVTELEPSLRVAMRYKLRNAIATALSTAYKAGLEAAAKECELDDQGCGCASLIRSMTRAAKEDK